jgi:hypothetical protein
MSGCLAGAGKPRFHLGGRVVRSRRLPDRAEEDIGQVAGIALAIWADCDFRPIFPVPHLDLRGQV